MNPEIVFEIIELAVSVAKARTTGSAARDVAVADTLFRIVKKSVEAYRDHTGQPLDVTLIKAEDTV